ncbi:MAG TPA: ABC transporter ATP-binding protein [Bacteroidales bacterium]|jgi:iron complex transport system ATP-binding protein|nr:ABC transporter ATP-binding protein [Bacteroidales bacterium]HOS71158.1 ABC transporter ATP-binding protein [Bacteroidales bacterium]HQH23251.1 ABC transporter ATP-binding protein [Bacteroidales bacterium]HQJ80891.1 ABC transporter ATP-binding protein [Bacteroidales bacterium]
MKITIQDIEFSYNGFPALENVNNRIEKGDFVALVGPNGSGKSTLIKCMNGILKVSKGTVLIDDRAISMFSPNELAREIAYVPQSENRKAVLKVFDIVLLGRKPYINWKPAEHDLRVTSEILNTLNLDHLAMRDFNKLSGGQQQIVYIARALAQEPDILLLDEPIANLDIRHQIEVLNLLKKLSARGITIVIALHDINMAVRYASGIMMLRDGKVFASGGREIITKQNIENLYDIRVKIIRNDNDTFILPEGL